MMNKKGATFALWGEAIISVLFILVIVGTLILPWMNTTYDKDYSTGMDTSGLEEWEQLERNVNQEAGGEVTQTDGGLSLLSSWTMAKAIFDTIGSFMTGGFINKLVVDVMGLPVVLAVVLRILFLMSLIYILIKLFFKTNP